MLSIQYFVQVLEINPIQDPDIELTRCTMRPPLDPLWISPYMNPHDLYFPDLGFYYGHLSFNPDDVQLVDSSTAPTNELLPTERIRIRNDIKSPSLVPICQQLVHRRWQLMKSHIMISPVLTCIVQPSDSHGLMIQGLTPTEFMLTTNNLPKLVLFADGSTHYRTFKQLTELGPFDFKPMFQHTRPENLNLQLKTCVTGNQLGFYADHHMKPRLMTRDDCLKIGGNIQYLQLWTDAPDPYFLITKTPIDNKWITAPQINMSLIQIPSVYGFAEYIGDHLLFIIYSHDSRQMIRAYQCIDWQWILISIDEVNSLYQQYEYI